MMSAKFSVSVHMRPKTEVLIESLDVSIALSLICIVVLSKNHFYVSTIDKAF